MNEALVHVFRHGFPGVGSQPHLCGHEPTAAAAAAGNEIDEPACGPS